jgi:hypothetical protein
LAEPEHSGASKGSNTNRFNQYDTSEVRKKIENAAENLCRFIDPHGVLDSNEGSRWPLVIFAFDESHMLTESPDPCGWTLFSALRDTLRVIVKKPIFSLFVSTAGSLLQIESGPWGPINDNLRLLDPITEISFDDIAYHAKEDTVSLSEVVTTDWISHLGRPLCVHFTYSSRD